MTYRATYTCDGCQKEAASDSLGTLPSGWHFAWSTRQIHVCSMACMIKSLRAEASRIEAQEAAARATATKAPEEPRAASEWRRSEIQKGST